MKSHKKLMVIVAINSFIAGAVLMELWTRDQASSNDAEMMKIRQPLSNQWRGSRKMFLEREESDAEDEREILQVSGSDKDEDEPTWIQRMLRSKSPSIPAPELDPSYSHDYPIDNPPSPEPSPY
ncbi:hypothetical protein AKJ16_DCAP08133 [Drosera capensis]